MSIPFDRQKIPKGYEKLIEWRTSTEKPHSCLTDPAVRELVEILRANMDIIALQFAGHGWTERLGKALEAMGEK